MLAWGHHVQGIYLHSMPLAILYYNAGGFPWSTKPCDTAKRTGRAGPTSSLLMCPVLLVVRSTRV